MPDQDPPPRAAEAPHVPAPVTPVATTDEGSDPSIALPGAVVAAPPGKPDGEVDTRST